MTEHTILPLKAHPGMPPRQPVDMPVQDLRRAPDRRTPRRTAPAVVLARVIAFGGAALASAAGTYEMVQVVSIGGVTILEGLMTAIFAITFGWIAFSATSAVAGAISPPARHVRLARMGGRLSTRTALVMPIYHEDPVRTAAALEVMARGLQEVGEAAAFEIVILSDSTKSEAWIAETSSADRLRRDLSGIMPVWYRRRWLNTAKKAGNIKEFVEGWGGRYAHVIVLDADSLMSPQTIVTLAAAMEVDHELGILQTIPVLAGGRSLFARLHQFAGRIYGPVVSRGLAAWQGSDGNYWGHNAIIRTRAFAACCGLPELPGKKPFGGAILSHDFVEAALMRRAGWRVEMASRLEGSWEESPPSLIDAAVRDRRWAQGNLQHLKVIGARGLAWPSRVHFAVGVMSYLASPLWLLLIAFGFALSLQATLIRPEYFSDSFQLFPTWPHFDSERMIRLFALTMLVLFLPKMMGLARALARPDLRRDCGGGVRLVASAFVEIVVSALLAPIMMVIHSRQIYEIVVGHDAGWTAQRRDGSALTWGDAWRRHRWHTACGLAMAAAAWFLSPGIFGWLLPTLTGLFLAIPLSRASGSTHVGAVLRRAGLLVIPEERNPDPLFQACEAASVRSPQPPSGGINALAFDPALRATHYRWASSAPRFRGAPDAAYLTASEKILDAHSIEEALSWLEPRERLHVAGHQNLAEQLAKLPTGDGPRPATALPNPANLDYPVEAERIRSPAA